MYCKTHGEVKVVDYNKCFTCNKECYRCKKCKDFGTFKILFGWYRYCTCREGQRLRKDISYTRWW